MILVTVILGNVPKTRSFTNSHHPVFKFGCYNEDFICVESKIGYDSW